jgi:hypothetical protein
MNWKLAFWSLAKAIGLITLIWSLIFAIAALVIKFGVIVVIVLVTLIVITGLTVTLYNENK